MTISQKLNSVLTNLREAYSDPLCDEEVASHLRNAAQIIACSLILNDKKLKSKTDRIMQKVSLICLLSALTLNSYCQPAPPTIPGWSGNVPMYSLPPGTVMDFQKWYTMCSYCLTTNVLRAYATNQNGGATIPPGTTYITNIGSAPIPGATCTTNLQISTSTDGKIVTNIGVTCVFMSGGSKQEYSLNFWCPKCGAFFTQPGPPRFVPTIQSIPAVPVPKTAGYQGREEMVLPGVVIPAEASHVIEVPAEGGIVRIPIPRDSMPPPPPPGGEVTHVYEWVTNDLGDVKGILRAVMPQPQTSGGVQSVRPVTAPRRTPPQPPQPPGSTTQLISPTDLFR